MNEKDLERSIKKKFKSLFSTQVKFVPHWKKITRYILPKWGLYDRSPQSWLVPDYSEIIDSTATNASDIVVSGLINGLMPQNQQWFKLRIKNNPELMNNDSVKRWLFSVEKTILDIFDFAKIYNYMPQIFEECAGFGCAAALTLENQDSVISMRNFTVGQYAFAENNLGEIDTLAADLFSTTSQLKDEFGYDNLPDSVQYECDKDSDKTYCVGFFITKNDNYEYKGRKINQPFVSFYWIDDKNEEGFLRVGKFYDFPALTPRWERTKAGNPYGSGNGVKVLGKIFSIKELEDASHLGIEYMAKPPLQINSVQRITSIKRKPGEVNFIDFKGGTAGARNLFEVNFDINALEAKLAQKRKSIEDDYGASLFLMVAGASKEMTAYEVAKLQSEQLLRFGPVFQRLVPENITRLIERTFGIGLRGHLFEPVPQELAGAYIDIEYTGLLAQALKMAEVNALGNAISFAGNLLQIKPDIADLVNWDTAVRKYFNITGVAPDVLKKEDEVDALRQQRAAQQAQAAEAAQSVALLDTAAKMKELQQPVETRENNANA
ncbi:MAG: hypothetical protein LBL00_07810 [Endomicrobium sp.]|jgi:hypothetical protein|nr:hypothetical protein [Endomicrobium sp.]